VGAPEGTTVTKPASPLAAVFLVGKAGFEPAASASRRPPGGSMTHVLEPFRQVSTVERVRPDGAEWRRMCHGCAIASGGLIKRVI
jgi:hypothetical protein